MNSHNISVKIVISHVLVAFSLRNFVNGKSKNISKQFKPVICQFFIMWTVNSSILWVWSEFSSTSLNQYMIYIQSDACFHLWLLVTYLLIHVLLDALVDLIRILLDALVVTIHISRVPAPSNDGVKSRPTLIS